MAQQLFLSMRSLRIQHFTHFVSEGVAAEGLGQEFDAFVDDAAVGYDVGGVAAHKEAFHLRQVRG